MLRLPAEGGICNIQIVVIRLVVFILCDITFFHNTQIP